MILEALFNGDIYASENIVPKSDKFRQNAEEITGILNTLQEKLAPEHFALLERLCDRYADEGNLTNETQFKYGFTLGVLMMCEIFHSPLLPQPK